MGLMQYKRKFNQMLNYEATVATMNLVPSPFRGGKNLNKLFVFLLLTSLNFLILLKE